MTNAEVRAAAITKLSAAGVDVSGAETLEAISSLVEQATNRKRSPRVPASEFIYMYAAPKVPPRDAPKFAPLRVVPHFRAADIDAAQPPMMTPCGTGNYNQYSQYMLDNGMVR